MPTDTDLRLRSWLDSNQRDREQMCRSILALDQRYSQVRPRHPLGGPDGGRDIEAVFEGARIAFGAVGFQNSANDSDEQRRRIRSKFSDDLAAALAARPDLEAFVFLTNLHFTMGEQSEMKAEAIGLGIEHCDVLDRERLRIELDSPGGFFIRFQHLGIPLSEAEQASFLSRYGDAIQQVVTTGFRRVERTLSRLLFLEESRNVLGSVYVRFHLQRSFAASEIGHFRAFVSLHLRAVKHDILSIWFGSTDKSMRFRTRFEKLATSAEPSGIAYGIATGAWEQHVRFSGSDQADDDVTGDDGNNRLPKLIEVRGGSSVGMDPVRAIVTYYGHDDALIRLRPRLELRDLDDCMFLPIVNLSLARKIHSIEVFANGYKLLHIGPDDFIIDQSPFENTAHNDAFTEDELADSWVRIRPSTISSTFHLSFGEETPKRMYAQREVPDPMLPQQD